MLRASIFARQGALNYSGGSSLMVGESDSLGPEREIAKLKGISVGLGLDELHAMKSSVEGLYDESEFPPTFNVLSRHHC